MGFRIKKYATFDDYSADLRALQVDNPLLCEIHTDRYTYGGDYPIYWVTIGDITKPAIFIVSVLHAKEEWQGAHLVMAFMKRILDVHDQQREFHSRLLDHFSIVAIPMVNVWGYFASPDGKHYNNHGAPVPGIDGAEWHDMTEYDYYYGVNLNRNFDWNWDAYPSLPWAVSRYWNGQDYGFANYFMMPFYLNEEGEEVYDPDNTRGNHILRPDPDVYDYKGSQPFSEPETQLIRDLFSRYDIAGFIDVHLMMPSSKRNASYISRSGDRNDMVRLVDQGLATVNRRNRGAGVEFPDTRHIVMEEYDNNAPYSINWAQNKMGVRAFAWETGTDLPQEVWTDAYMEMFYRAIYWMQSGAKQAPEK